MFPPVKFPDKMHAEILDVFGSWNLWNLPIQIDSRRGECDMN
jgi:hypothetical protein